MPSVADTSKVNRRLVRSQIAGIRRSVRRLRQLGGLPKEHFLASPDNFAIAEHHLRRSLEAVFDAGRHIAARSGLGAAQEYADVPRLLEEGGVLTADTAKAAAALARLRNRLVHFYWQVDAEEMHSVLGERLTLVEAFCREVLAWLSPHQATDGVGPPSASLRC